MNIKTNYIPSPILWYSNNYLRRKRNENREIKKQTFTSADDIFLKSLECKQNYSKL